MPTPVATDFGYSLVSLLYFLLFVYIWLHSTLMLERRLVTVLSIFYL
ncbi:hypothetical protein HMPREF0758_1710 [Serratia odorifera DSM 4582]|uniref:Uncharacterized protein n=1 Tax=Serratia odorifera DSM 4582 TaxID=667129 RepID=D4E0L0_SEROD|nr:hypothetical protein HMPREF0758_1710 [Serratia odorifera DSM 4582]